jgi:predicted transposase YbfD/YdcC
MVVDIYRSLVAALCCQSVPPSYRQTSGFFLIQGDTMASNEQNLNPTHQLFIAAMARNHWKIKESAEEVGMNYNTARHLAARTHIRRQIQKQIDKVVEKIELDHEYVIRSLQELVDYDPEQLIRRNETSGEMEQIPLEELPPEIRRCIGTKPSDRRAAMADLAKIQGMFIDKSSVTYTYAGLLDEIEAEGNPEPLVNEDDD